jgi:hypothetical protein
MNRKIPILLGAASLAAWAAGCSNGSQAPNDPVGQNHQGPNAGSEASEYQHVAGAADPTVDPGSLAQAQPMDDPINAPVEEARYHACGKITYASLGSILATRGVNMASTTQNSAALLYKGGAAALGIANYGGRVPEAILASTSALAKEFDIFVAAAPEVDTNLTNGAACPGTTIVDANGQFTKDGISCIIGKLAQDAHVAVANQAVADAVKGGATQAQAVQIAIAALMEAAHTCE